MIRGLWGISALGLAAALSPAAAAEETAVSNTKEPVRLAMASVQDSDIVVTGQKGKPGEEEARLGVLGERTLIETPFAITVLERDIIVNQQAIVLSDVLKNDPSFTSGRNRGSFADSYYIRGFSALGNTFYDGVFGPAANSLLPPLDGIERVEILKGPATFLYGVTPNGGVGGAINLVPKRPSAEPVTDVTASFVDRSQFGGAIDISRRFGTDDGFGIRANAAYREGGTVVKGSDETYISGVVALSFDSGPFHFYADGGAFRRDIDGYQNAFSLANTSVPVPKAPDASVPYSSLNGFYYRDQYRGLARASYDIADGWSASATYSYTKIKGDYISPGLPTILDAAGNYRVSLVNQPTQDSDLHSIDGMVHGRFDTGPITHEISLGGSVLWFDSFLARGGGTVQSFTTNLYNPVFPGPITTLVPTFEDVKTQDSKTTGLSIGDTLSILDKKVQLTLGLRRVAIDVVQRAAATGLVTADISNRAWTPLAAISWRVTPGFTLYANYAEALERGGVAPLIAPRAGATQTNSGEAQPALETTSYEGGFKLEAGKLLVNGAVFRITKGLEINRDNQPITGVNSFTYIQEGEQRHTGAELSTTGEIAPGFSLTGGVMYLDAKATRTATPAFNGRRAAAVPEWTFSLYADWAPKALDGFGMSAGLYHLSNQRYDIATDRVIPAWTRVDVGVRYGFEVSGRKVAARLAVDNLFDKNYWSSTIGSALTFGAPRTIKASVTVGL